MINVRACCQIRQMLSSQGSLPWLIQLAATISNRTYDLSDATKPNMINTKRNTDEKANWKNQKEKLRTAFPSLTDADVNFEYDRKNEMLGKLAMKLGQTTPELAAVMA